MVTFQTFLTGLLASSILTGLVTEGVKSIFTEHNKTYASNTLAGIIAIIVSSAISIGYVLFNGTEFNTQIIITIISLVFLSWLCSMVGYDKVVQAFAQIKTYRKGDKE